LKTEFAMRGNRWRRAHAKEPGRDGRFRSVASRRRRFAAAGLPVVGVDIKNKE
jgi:hypothetical protein